MADLFANVYPYGAIISYLAEDNDETSLREQEEKKDDHREFSSFELYFGDDLTYQSGLAERLPTIVSGLWSNFIDGIYLLPSDDIVRPYFRRRYALRFKSSDARSVVELFRNVGAVAELASLIDSRPKRIIRTERGWGKDTGINFAISIILDFVNDAFDATQNINALERQFMSAMLPSGARGWPSQYDYLLFVKGPVIGTLLDSLAVLRLRRPPIDRATIQLPGRILEWLDAADIAYIIREYNKKLKTQPLLAHDADNYIRPFSSPGEFIDFYKQFTVDKVRAVNEYLVCREAIDILGNKLKHNIFQSHQHDKLLPETAGSEISFHELLAAQHRPALVEFESLERKFLLRERSISDYVQEQMYRQSWEASDRLAERNNELVEANLKSTATQREAIAQGNELLGSSRAVLQESRAALEQIREYTGSTDTLTKVVVRLTWAIVGLTIVALLVGIIPDTMKENVLTLIGIVEKDPTPFICE